MRRPELPHAGLIQGARAFVLLVVAMTIGWTQDTAAISGLVALATTSVAASGLLRTRIPLLAVTVLEAATVAVIATLYLDSTAALVVALALPPFVHGLAKGLRGALTAVAVQVFVVSLVALVRATSLDPAQVAELFTWLVAGLGLGLLASAFVRQTLEDDSTVAYHEARALIEELNALSSKLEGGLDPTSMGGTVLDEVSAALPMEHVSLHVRRDKTLLPLVFRSSTEDHALEEAPEDVDALARQVWDSGRTAVVGHDFAFPVTSSGTPIAVVSGRLAAGLDPEPVEMAERLDRLAARLAPTALRLDTAQMFAAFRDAAMSEERRRLAREMHDGMAQDIASMGYVVDALISTATPAQEQALTQLRSMISRVVAEVRRSVMTLRTQAGSSESLGAAIATLARHLSDVSGTPIKVTADERTSRLRHEVEGELLRIAQEAMNNAVKHSQASLIDVHCRVQAPYAEIVVADDGLGLQAGRRDSHGLSIMRERAALIGGVLEVRSSPTRGTTVSVRVGSPERTTTPVPTTPLPGSDSPTRK